MSNDLRQFIDQYCASFTPGNAAAMPAFYHLPVTMIFADTLLVLSGAEELAAAFEQMLLPLAARGFKASRAERMAVTQLGENTFSVIASFSRYHQDGSVLEQVGASYTVLRGKNGYKIAMVVAHDADGLARYAQALQAA